MSDRSLSILMVDASLFTAPYDEGITKGLEENGAVVTWACRDPRPNEEYQLIRKRQFAGIFYPGLVGSAKNAGLKAKIIKAISHTVSLVRLRYSIIEIRPSIVHLQWTVFPLTDIICIYGIKRVAPVVLTIHDTIPFNGNPTSKLQTLGLSRVMRSVDHIIVHTEHAANTIRKIVKNHTPVSVISHGPLGNQKSLIRNPTFVNSRWTVVMFGKIQAYKGVDILVEAITLIDPEIRRGIKIIVAGEAFIEMESILKRSQVLGIGECIDFRLWRHSDSEVENLLLEADAFVFPYRQIDASGVLYLVAAYRKWIIASNIGIFHELVEENKSGSLVQPEDAHALSKALAESIDKKPKVELPIESWEQIGKKTIELYKRIIKSRSK
ncbi:glycosyltransferase family 4 protein [Methylobacterium sp. HMF5984]|uniref:glycosyltransferase family 4 protein n=1 Tax=Methylobacterium sp. HMF5984 TaxID=3367370 RepID=UPI003852DA92